VTQSEINWPAALRATESGEQAAAVSALRDVLQNGLRIALNGRSDVSEAHLEDFAQESLLRVLDRMDQFQGRSKFTTWAQAIALNVAFTELRRKRVLGEFADVLQTLATVELAVGRQAEHLHDAADLFARQALFLFFHQIKPF